YEEVLPFLRADNIFIYILLLLFFVALVSMLYLSDRFGKAVSGLHDFLVSTENHNPDYTRIRFPDTELGEIGNRIVTNYRLLCESRNLLDAEREKLLRHFHYSDEGICIFTPEGDTLYANSHFMQHLNTILDAPTSNPVTLLDEAAFAALSEFLKTHRPVQSQATSIPLWEGKISASGRHYAARLLIFNDNSYEITLNNITEIEKNRRLKQEMTNNIAHELKTPVTSIRGYLETLLEQPSIDAERHHIFLDRAYRQTLRLSDLIRDVALITKMEEATDLFERCEVSLHRVIEEVLTDLGPVMQRSKVTFENRITAPMQVMGDASLLYSVFWNLTDNAIHYAGEGVTLTLTCYAEDEGFYYLSFSDNGVGVPESELEKIFVRFYRVDAGRSRKTGGSGLGLSIVSNAVRYHGGQITAKNRREGGLEFLFSLAKEEGL
ncbi:MAG: HAMP domain-containing sensor histidine kinase, partial [Alistipes sp.]|nr:HAMP domain-containing sensor histidine kinase [Alistipes sp.]